MRCFGPVYLDLFFFLTFLVQLSYVPFHTVHLQDSIFGYHTSTQTGLCVIRYVTCNLWRGITHYICFLFHTLTLLVRLAWILISPERLREREGGGFSLSLCMYVCVHLCFCVSDTPTRARRSQGTAFDKLHLSEQQAHANRCSRREQKDCCWSL